jgi:hypothetical protein
LIVAGLPDFQCRLRQAARDFRKQRGQNDLIKSDTDGSGSKLRTDPGCKSQSQTKSKPEGRWDPSKELDVNMKKTAPGCPSDDQTSPVQEHSISSSLSRMYLKQFHAWHLFI